MREVMGSFKVYVSSNVIWDSTLRIWRIDTKDGSYYYWQNLNVSCVFYTAGQIAALLAQLRRGEQIREGLKRRITALEDARHLSPEVVHAAGQRAGLMSAGSMLQSMAKRVSLNVTGTLC